MYVASSSKFFMLYKIELIFISRTHRTLLYRNVYVVGTMLLQLFYDTENYEEINSLSAESNFQNYTVMITLALFNSSNLCAIF